MKARWSVQLDFGQHPPNTSTGANHCLWPPAGALQGWFRRSDSAYFLSNSYSAVEIQHLTYRAKRSMPQTRCCIVFKCNFIPCCINCQNPLSNITNPWTIPKPTSWQTIHCTRHWNTACSRRVPQERRCTGGTEWSQCPQRGLLEVFLEYFE